MFNKNSEYLTILLNEETLRIAQIKGSGSSLKLANAVSKSVEGLSEADLIKNVQTTLSPFNVKSTTHVYVIPPNMVSTKNIEIPSTNPEEIKSIVSLQAGRHTPFSREEIQVGYVNLGVFKSNYSKVLLVIANRGLLKKHLSVLERAGLKIKKVLFVPEGVANFYAEAKNLKKDSAPVGVIDIGVNATDFVIFSQGVPTTSRNIPVGRTQIGWEGEEARQKLLDELNRTLEAYQSEECGPLPSKIFLSLDDTLTKELAPIIQEKLKAEVSIVPYIDFVKASPNIIKKLAESADTSFLDVFTASSKAEQAQVNLIPEEFQLQKNIEDQGREVLKLAGAGFMILILVGCIVGFKIYAHSTFLNKLLTNYKDNRNKVAEIEQKSIQTKIVQGFLKSRMSSLDVISELYRKLPNEIYLTNINMDEDGNVAISGVSDIASLVFNLGTSLKESKLFESVNIKSTTAKKDRGKDVSAFEITMKLAGSKSTQVVEKTDKSEKSDKPEAKN